MRNAEMKKLLIAKTNGREHCLLSNMAHRHGLIAGGLGTGKTVTTQVMAERFSEIGVPVFMVDIKGDLAGLSKAGKVGKNTEQRIKDLGIGNYKPVAYPVKFLDVYREKGQPVTLSLMDLDDILMCRILNINEEQMNVLSMIFNPIRKEGGAPRELNFLIASVEYMAEQAGSYAPEKDHAISMKNFDAIILGMMKLHNQRENILFGKPVNDFHVTDFIKTAKDGRGIINILCADRLIYNPVVYSTLLMWMLMELYARLPETGELEKPKLVLFIDEVNLLFDNAPDALLQKMEQVIRLISSRGIGIYFVSRSLQDIPDKILDLLGNRIHHGIRAYTPKELSMVKDASINFRQNPNLDIEKVITEMSPGEALVSLLDGEGIPAPVERALVLPPESRLGPITQEERMAIVGEIPPPLEEIDIGQFAANLAKASSGEENEAAVPRVEKVKPKEGMWSEIKRVWNSEEAKKAGLLYLFIKLFK